MILTDNEATIDLLNNEAIATAVIGLLRNRPDQPITIGIHGDWGAGKSSILEMVQASVDADKSMVCLKFNGWQFQGFEDAKIALIEGIVTSLVEKRSLWQQAADSTKEVFKRIDGLKLIKKGAGLAFTLYTGLPSPGVLAGAVSAFEGLLEHPEKLLTKDNVTAAVAGLKDVVKPAAPKNVPDEIREFHKAFNDLLERAGIERLVVLVDDLDRCLPETAIETLEAIRLFVFTEKTAFVVAADEAMIEYSVRKHFPDLPDSTGPRDYARNYLEKLIQIPIRIPALGESETRVYVTLLLVGSVLGDKDEHFKALLDIARTHLKRPWKESGLSDEAIKTALGESAPRVANELRLSDQLAPILANGTRGNPRQIKRFLNALLLRKYTADARGFGDDIRRPALAKLMLAEQFLPRVYDQIASVAASDPNGRCADLALLEEESRKDASTKKSPAVKGAKKTIEVQSAEPRSGRLAEWTSATATLAWAALDPALAEADLRPYLFVAKDRKDYFGATSALGKLAAVVDKLMGAKILVQQYHSDLKNLAAPEAGQVFEGVKARVVGSDKFDSQPPGIEGLSVLVRAHPALQGSLIDLLESLPSDRLGPWAPGGWALCVTDPAQKIRLNALLELWATHPTNKKLAIAALGTQKFAGGR